MSEVMIMVRCAHAPQGGMLRRLKRRVPLKNLQCGGESRGTSATPELGGECGQ